MITTESSDPTTGQGCFGEYMANHKIRVRQGHKSALGTVFTFTEKELLKIKTRAYSALDAFVRGQGNSHDLALIITRISNGRELAINYYTDEAGESLHRTIVSLGGVYIYFKYYGKWMIEPDLCAEVTSALNAVDTMQDELTRREFLLAYNNAVDVEISSFEDLVLPWDKFKALRASLLRKHGRKVIVKP